MLIDNYRLYQARLMLIDNYRLYQARLISWLYWTRERLDPFLFVSDKLDLLIKVAAFGVCGEKNL